ncbi:MAG: methionyl-tRNA formyltransferase [Coxiellaceae bacterium]|nr:methionyl-tRNA formyltransferase [Coxiellaceae bacterium]
MPLNIIFAGTPDFAVPTLQALITASPHKLLAVFTQPDRPAGRGQHLHASPVKTLAANYHIPIFQPKTLRDADVQAEIKKLNPDVIVVVAYGLILPQAVLDIPRFGCINIHPSLLPRWRGAAPIQRTIEAGDTETAVTIMKMDKGMDTGPILLQEKILLEGTETAGVLHDFCSQRGAALLLTVLRDIEIIKPIPQTDEGATHAAKLEKSESKIDWERSLVEIDCQIRAMNPWPIATMLFQQQPLKIFEAVILSTEKTNHTPGDLFQMDNKLCVAASDGVLEIKLLQLPGKKIMSAKDFLNGHLK